MIAGAATFTGVDQLNPFFPGALSTQNTSANSASLVLSQTATRDAMFGTIAIANAGNTSNLRTSGSVDTVVADARWTNRCRERARRRRHALGQHRARTWPRTRASTGSGTSPTRRR